MSAAVLISDVRSIAEVAATTPAPKLVETLGRITECAVSAIESSGGIVHTQIGGSAVAYWPSDGLRAIEAAAEVVRASGGLTSVAVSVGDVTSADVGRGPAKRQVLVGRAYQHAERVLRSLPLGAVGVDIDTYRSLPDSPRSRFVLHDTYAVLREVNAQPAARHQRA